MEPNTALRFSRLHVEAVAQSINTASLVSDEQRYNAWQASQIYLRLNGELVSSQVGDEKSRNRIQQLLQQQSIPTIIILPGGQLPRWPGPSQFW